MSVVAHPLPKNNSRYNLIKKDIPLVASVLLMLATGIVVYFFFPRPSPAVIPKPAIYDCPQNLDELRLKDYKLTHPLMFADIPNEDGELSGLKEKINAVISQNKSLGVLNDISVYFMKMDEGKWFVINGEKTFTPASLMKVAFLIATLRQAGSSPGFLDKKIYFEKHFQDGYDQNIKNFSLKEKKSYTVRELLFDMIAYSDNDALTLISMNTDVKVLKKLFTDLGIAPPPLDPDDTTQYVVKLSDYCRLFRILYNSGYLLDEYSELGLSMLSQSTYKDGLLKSINPSFPVAHKFGERVTGSSAELHEIGIFYADPEPYLLGVMSNGHDLKNLSEVLSQISHVVYRSNNKGS